ncbi:Outer membrane protein assembly factor BamB precursor [Pirellula sp. SH-Sr6A]|uniref:PQQ-binding-like beta-propeller repeat protein n=1 Tax=Pirellula sp. SH-Sr6A TaxID=1632865 RepID=UPI00078C40E9|nr:PQQ-binding-like beta-propeller repeat protein [Pirellula sp. SH-Sr6A]AMV34628.1 Outer membrane protein assembly factor BamB precursor [Pirellula sp. SH-Sr6A]
MRRRLPFESAPQLSIPLRTFALTGLLAFAQAPSSLAENWGHWRGPNGNGVALTGQPPTEFSDTTNVKWKVAIPGKSSGSPVVWGQKVFAVTAAPTSSGNRLAFQVYCFDRQTGKTLWQQTALEAAPHESTHETNTYASASPCTDGEHVYAHFGSQGLFCYTMDGKLVWKRDFGDMTIRNGFGEGSSPTIVDDKIIVPWDHEQESKLFALNKKTGDVIWTANRPEPTCWSTPHIAISPDGSKQVVMNGQNAARGYDLNTGKELWHCGGQTERPCASAVSANGTAIVASGYRGAFIGAFDLSGRGNLAATDKLRWSHKENTPDVASPVLSGNRVYYYKARTGLLTCVDIQTGKVLFSAARVPGIKATYASPIAAGGHLYLTDREGTIVVVRDSDSLAVVATNSIGEGVDATPAVADNELFIRGEKHLFCIAAP